ncbi:porin [Paraburkholderia megapolitana]|uniref:porin n=1 Tax=Paraburkholderia megapolitana TaxID=420953 RepID=UPI0038B941FE
MKWRIAKLALGVSCVDLAGTAHAQSSVTLYGIVDAGIEYLNHTGGGSGTAHFVPGAKNVSRFGLRGVEDLGGGLKAVFQLENGFDIANGAFDVGKDVLFDRRATIGLKNRFGQWILGRTFTVTFDYMLPFDPMGYAGNYSWGISTTAPRGRRDGLLARSSSAVRYDGEFAGVKIGGLYGFGNVPGSVKTSSRYNVALGYGKGPFATVVTFDRQNGARSSVTPADSINYIQGIHAGLSYDFGTAKVMAGYRNHKRSFTTPAAALRSATYWFGGSCDVTPVLTLVGAVYHQNIKGGSNADPTLFSLRGQYALSKQTLLYLAGGYVMAKHGQQISLSRDLTAAADNQAGMTAGVQHRF